MPSTALASIARLRRIAAAIEDGRAPAADDAAWLARRLRRYLDSAPRGGWSLDLCLDLTPAQGAAPWWEDERIDQRNAVMRVMADKHFPDLDPGPAAKAIMTAWERYSRVRKAIDLRRGDSEAGAGTLEAALFSLAQFGGPPGHRSVRNIIANAAEPAAA